MKTMAMQDMLGGMGAAEPAEAGEAVGGERAARILPAAPSLRFAGEDHFESLRHFRAGVFRDELGIQDPDYQDVFNDYFSKNIILTRGGQIDGAVRLAYSGDAGVFFISYLTVRGQRRRRADIALLLGAIFYLMRENGIRSICGHGADENLAMYLSAGCRPTGSPFRKYGFSCEWTPVVYELGTNGPQEERLAERAARHLDACQARWEFTLRVVSCADLHELDEALRRLLSTGALFGMLPHLGRLDPALISLPHIRGIESVTLGGLGEGTREGFDYYNSRFDPTRSLFVRRGSDFLALARIHGVLGGRRVIVLDGWNDLRRNHNGCIRKGLVLASENETSAVEAATAAVPQVAWSLVAARNPEEMSTRLLLHYLRTLGPELAATDSAV